MGRRSGTEEATADCTTGDEAGERRTDEELDVEVDEAVDEGAVDALADGVADDLAGEAPEVVTGRDGEAERITDSGAADDIDAEIRAEAEAATDRCTCAGLDGAELDWARLDGARLDGAEIDRAGLADADGLCGAAERITAEGRIGREAEPGDDGDDCDVGQAEANRAPNS